ncbi:MAG: alpha/beta fold hydrolase BchO [Pseudomonadota bacterium]
MLLPTERPDFERDGAAWPNRAQSRFVRSGGLRWHVQSWEAPEPSAPTLLLLHGTGAATHSWAGLAPLLAERARIVAPDLPGHGFTETPSWPSRLSLQGMSAAVGGLLGSLGAAPDLVVGHSAGAALAIQMTLDGRIAPRRVIGLNAALRPFQGFAGAVFPQLAKLLFVNPLVPRMFAAAAQNPGRVRQLLEGTGSAPPPEIFENYARLFRAPGHVAGALGMMAHWDLDRLRRASAGFAAPTSLFAAALDKTIPPWDAVDAAGRFADAEIVEIPRLGHLAHEEDPETIARLIYDRM